MPWKPGPGILVERPALGAVIAGRLRPVERPLALAAIEAAHVAAAERHPHDALAVDVGAARAEAGHRHVVDLGERRLRRIRRPARARTTAPGIAERRAPDRAVDRARHHRVERRVDARVLRRIGRLRPARRRRRACRCRWCRGRAPSSPATSPRRRSRGTSSCSASRPPGRRRSSTACRWRRSRTADGACE